MDLQSESASPVFAEAASLTASRLGTCSGLLPYSPRYPPALLMIPRNRSGIVDDLRSISWLDAMKSSSPSQKQTMKDPNSEFASAEDDNVAHNAWTFRYPSALASFEKITKCAKGKRMALFLDYDGTLSPIVDSPDNAVMSSAMRSAVRNVAKFIPTAIISGRSCRKVYEFVGLSELYYAGSHGMDIMGPGRQSDPRKYTDIVKSVDEQYKDKRFQPACEFLPMINEIFRSLIESMSEIKGAKVENNKFCVSVHYRNVDETSWGTIAQRVHDILKHYPRVQLTHGRKVLEVRPVIDWNKGRALEFLLESLGLSNCNDVLPIYIGDDQTDEDAFKVLRDRNIGYGILVSSAPRESNAYYSLKDPLEVLEFLKSLVTWKKAPNTL